MEEKVVEIEFKEEVDVKVEVEDEETVVVKEEDCAFNGKADCKAELMESDTEVKAELDQNGLFTCGICGKKFITAGFYRGHIKTHQLNLFKCSKFGLIVESYIFTWAVKWQNF